LILRDAWLIWVRDSSSHGREYGVRRLVEALIFIAVFIVSMTGCEFQMHFDRTIQGYLIDETRMCVTEELVVLGRAGEGLSVRPQLEACYQRDDSKIHAWTDQLYPELESQGWAFCDSDFYYALHSELGGIQRCE